MGSVFKCDQSEDCLSSVMGEILNDGANRFNCFYCDFDLCRTCVRKQLKRVGNSSAGMSNAGGVGGGGGGTWTPSNLSAASSMVNIYENPVASGVSPSSIQVWIFTVLLV